MRGTQTRASMVIQASNGFQRGMASTASGSSHSEYCGLHTLLVSRNAAITSRHTWASRGRVGADIVTQAMPAQQSRNSTALTVFRIVGTWFCASTPSKPSQPVKYETTLYSESGSAPRSVLRRKNSHQPGRYRRYIGAFTATHVISAVAVVVRPCFIRPPRQHNSSSG